MNELKGLKELEFLVFLKEKSEELNPSIPYENFFVYYGGESQLELQERINNTICSLMKEAKGNSILIVSHGAVIRNFARVWENMKS